MSPALVKTWALKLLKESGGELPSKSFLQSLEQLQELQHLSKDEVHAELCGLIHRGALTQSGDCYRSSMEVAVVQTTVPEFGLTAQPIGPEEIDWSMSDLIAAAADRALQQHSVAVEAKTTDAAQAPTASAAYEWRMPDAKRARCAEPVEQRGNLSSVLLAGKSEPALPGVNQMLSEEQRHVVHVITEGRNVFFTGLPGTGKSFTLCAAIEALRKKLHHEGELAICASTGAAACHVGGGTVHSFLSCGLGKNQADFDGMMRAQVRLKRVKTLVVDEISMLSGEFLENASAGLSKVRQDSRPFGGIQVVLCGDFLQLPPVSSDSALQRPGAKRFAFQAPCWKALGMQCFELTQNFRQVEDMSFRGTLQRLRNGQMSEQDRAMLLAKTPQGSSKTTLYCRNMDVERENLRQLAALPGSHVVYTAQDHFNGNQWQLQKILDKCMLLKELKLKVGARVMMLKNRRLPNQCQHGQLPIVNGSLGTVLGFSIMPGGDSLPVVGFDNGAQELIGRETVSGTAPGQGDYTRMQVPLKLAWAVSVHKSQGMTLDGGIVDLRGAFEMGQVYVALSRFRSARDLAVLGLPPQLRVSVEAQKFHESLQRAPQVADRTTAEGRCSPAGA